MRTGKSCRLWIHTIFAALACLSVAPAIFAQEPRKKEPAFFAGENNLDSPEVPPSLRVSLRAPSEFALDPLGSSELAWLAKPSDPPRIGVHRDLAPGALDKGAWEMLADGGTIWRIALRSPGAVGIRVQFSDFNAGKGKVWLHGDQVIGPYTGRGIFENGEFWSASAFSESVTIEYQPEPGRSPDDPVPFRIAKISHQTEVFDPPAPVELPANGLLAVIPSNTAASCHLDPNCYPEWQDSMKMVAQLMFESEEGKFACSGSLLATRNDSLKPYLLTASHCASSEAVARSLEAFWAYQTPGCAAPPPLTKEGPKSQGAHYLVSGNLSAGDFSLLLLQSVPGGVWFAGWDPSDPPYGGRVVGIHHPKASYKRISFGRRVLDDSAVVAGYQAGSGFYYQVLWNQGRIEPGSSGSPLFSGPGVVVGVASYAPVSPSLSACAIDPFVSGYGRFSIAFPYLRDYLEDLPATEVTPTPANLQFKSLNGVIAAPVSQTIALTTESATPVTFKARSDAAWIKLSASSGTLSSSAPASVEVWIDPRFLPKSGSFASTVTILSGAAAPQFVDVRAELKLDRSNVAIAIAPNPVYEQPPDADGARWSFQIRIAEKAGVATRLTSVKMNGIDYSRYISSWFGADRIDGSGSLAADLRSAGPFFPGDQYFEFAGVDESSGQPWYQTAVVAFVPLKN
jgi:hypothetical protein